MSRFWKWGDWGVTLKCQRPVYATVVIYWACIINQLKISETKIDFFDPKIILIFINWLKLKLFRTKNKFSIILMIEFGTLCSLKSLELNLGPKYPTRSCSKQNKWKWKNSNFQLPRCRHGRCAAIRLCNRFCEKLYS